MGQFRRNRPCCHHRWTHIQGIAVEIDGLVIDVDVDPFYDFEPVNVVVRAFGSQLSGHGPRGHESKVPDCEEGKIDPAPRPVFPIPNGVMKTVAQQIEPYPTPDSENGIDVVDEEPRDVEPVSPLRNETVEVEEAIDAQAVTCRHNRYMA